MGYQRSILVNLIVIILSYFIYSSYSALNIINLTELDKCPFCYGKSACADLYNGNIKLNSSVTDIFYNLVNYFINTKNIYYGTYRFKTNLYEDIIVKKLANTEELRMLDTFMRKHYDDHTNFDKLESDFKVEIIKFLTESGTNEEVKLRLCPDPKSFDVLINDRREVGIEDYINFYTMLQINPEPILVQTLSALDGWPVPQYYGSCGRVSLFEDCGTRLTSLLNTDWCERARIVKDVLHMAYNLTYSHPRLSVYVTDISTDNLAVTSDGIVKLVDLEHTIVVDKNPHSTDLPSSWFTLHQSEHMKCDNCFAYSANDVCSHRISDHNFYAFCKEVLSNQTSIPHNWILNSPPAHLNAEAYLLASLIDSCVSPPPSLQRKTIVKQIIETINTILTEKC